MIARNLPLERERTHAPAELLYGVKPFALVRFAEERAGGEAPVRDLDDRDFDLEVREELADARNYLVWRLAQLDRKESRANGTGHRYDEIRAALAQSLAAVALAFEHIERATRIAEETR